MVSTTSKMSSLGIPAISSSFTAGLTKSIRIMPSVSYTREKGGAPIACDLVVL